MEISLHCLLKNSQMVDQLCPANTPPFATLALVQNAGGLIRECDIFTRDYALSSGADLIVCRGWGMSARWRDASDAIIGLTSFSIEGRGSRALQSQWLACPSLMRRVCVCARHYNGRQPLGISIFRLQDESSWGRGGLCAG